MDIAISRVWQAAVRTLVALTVLCIHISPVSSAEPVPTKRALLIGIDDYKASGVTDLRGCVNDVELMKNILIGKFDVPAENVEVLKDTEATHQKIVDTIRSHLIDKAQPGDIVILHYSGHGSQMRDASGDEIDEYDETLVPHDSRTEGVFDITDDQVNGLLKQLTAKTKNVTFIFDSCHSGAAIRAGNAVREIQPDDRPPPLPPDYAISSRSIGEGDADFRLNGSDYVLISGCLATELSNEAMFNQRRHGVMTWFLAQALQAAGDTSTYRSIMDEVSAEVTHRYPSQQPQLEGPGTHLRVFGTDRINPLPYVLARPLDGQTVELEGGKVYGLREGSVLKVYAPGTADFAKAEATATVKLTQVDDFTARAVIEEGGPVESQSKAVLESVMYGDTSIPVYVGVEAHSSLRNVAAMLESYPAITLTGSGADARVIVDVGGDGSSITINSGDLELLVPPVSLSADDHVERVVRQVQDIVHWLTVMDLKSPTQAIAIEFELQRKDDPAGAAEPRKIPPETQLTYRVHNRDNEPLFVYVLDVSSDGSIALLYPQVDGAQEELPPKGTLEKTIETFLPEGRDAVIDVLKVIATTRPINPSVFPQGAIRGAPPPPATRGGQDPLQEFLSTSVRAKTRGARPVEVKSWVTTQKSITIRKPGVRFSGFALHFEDSIKRTDLPASFGASRSACSGSEAGAECFEPFQAAKDGTVWDLVQRKATRDAAETVKSVGRAFDEAYQVQDQTPGAVRVEPLLDVQVPGLVDQRGIDKRSVGSDTGHDDAAENDDQWHLKQIRAIDAWQKIRASHGVAEGAEADGVLVAHIDTGYRDHPETWNEVGGKRPIDPSKGHDYYDNDDDPSDPLLNDLPLDNPGHGTAAGSVIVSPTGCQLAGAPACVHGVGRGSQLVPLRVHRTVSQFNTSNLSRAIRDVAEGEIEGAPKLISIAMGGPPTLSMWKAVKAAERSGVLIVAAAGNHVRTVVWPARFASTIAVAASNVRCRPWKHSSRGNKVDISAPGESVWRATLNEQHQDINAMGKGTTFATGNTSGSAALWLAWHKDNPKMTELRENGQVTKIFRNALQASAWRPAADPAQNPPGTHCDTTSWDEDKYGAGIINVAGLLDVPLDAPGTRALAPVAEEPEELPLFASLYPAGTSRDEILEDYRSLFGGSLRATPKKLYRFETEILYHYTVEDDVQRSIDAVVSGQRGAEPTDRVRDALRKKDLSNQLRDALL